MGGELGTFTSSRTYATSTTILTSKAYCYKSAGRAWSLYGEDKLGGTILSPKAYMGEELGIFQVPEPIWQCQI